MTAVDNRRTGETFDYPAAYIELKARVDPAARRGDLGILTSTDPIYGLGVPTENPCPAWCVEKPGHGYDVLDDDGRLTRWHAAFEEDVPVMEPNEYGHTTQTVWVSVAALELAPPGNPAGAVFQEPELRVQVDPWKLTAAEARQVAAALNEAADKLDGITGGAA